MHLEYSPKTLEACGISQQELKERIRLLEKHLGELYLEALFTRYGGLSIVMVNQICERSILFETLASDLGFSQILKRIVNYQDSPISLDEPHGDWFQLIVGYLLKSIQEQPAFEQKIGGAPKDILIRDGSIQIECKSFRGGKATEQVISDVLLRGKAPSEPDNLDGFTVQYELLVPFPGGQNQYSYRVNEFKRLFANGIDAKLRQMLPGACNLLAFNSDLFVGDLELFRATLTSTLADYPRISGLLVIHNTFKLPGDPYKWLGFAYAFELISNEHAEIAVPTDLQQALAPQAAKIALRK